MKSKMTTNSQLSTNEPKRKNNENKNSANNQIRNRIREMDITWRDFSGEGEGRNREERYREEEARLVGIR